MATQEVWSHPHTPFEALGGEDVVRRIVAAFYRNMAEREPALARLHEVDPAGYVSPRTVQRFGDFFVEWLGGPRLFSAHSGHPRLRMRHAHVQVDVAQRDAWMRAMRAGLDEVGVHGEARDFVEGRLADVANFLRNVPEREPSL
ncbi:MAG TPA: cyanoglobin [Polyangiaceae bacterium]|nr:cyanoglobin [Polyangiaceae bacterium]